MLDLFIKCIVFFVLCTSCNNTPQQDNGDDASDILAEFTKTVLSDSIPPYREVHSEAYHPFGDDADKESTMVRISPKDTGDTLSIMGRRYKVMKMEGRHLILDDINQDTIFKIGKDYNVDATSLSENGIPLISATDTTYSSQSAYVNVLPNITLKEKLLDELWKQPHLSTGDIKHQILKYKNEVDNYVLVYAFTAPVDHGVLFKMTE